MASSDGEDPGTAVRVALSAVVVLLAVPGLVIEPGPLSELAALAALGAIWGIDLPGGN